MSAHSSPEPVAMAGAGMAGLATAWFLQERGVRTTVVDRAGVAAGASWGNAGLINPAFTTPQPEPSVLRFGLKSMFDPSSPLVIPITGNRRLWTFLAEFARHCTASRWQRSMTVFNDLNRGSISARVHVAGGHGMWGMVFGPVTGKALAGSITGRPCLSGCTESTRCDETTTRHDTR